MLSVMLGVFNVEFVCGVALHLMLCTVLPEVFHVMSGIVLRVVSPVVLRVVFL